MLHKRVGQGEIFINIYESEGRKKGGRGEGIDGRKKGRKEGESFALFLKIHNIKGYSDHENT